VGPGVCDQPTAGLGRPGSAAPQRLLPGTRRTLVPRSQGRPGIEKDTRKRLHQRSAIRPSTGCFETLFGATASGRCMPTPGGRITPTTDTTWQRTRNARGAPQGAAGQTRHVPPSCHRRTSGCTRFAQTSAESLQADRLGNGFTERLRTWVGGLALKLLIYNDKWRFAGPPDQVNHGVRQPQAEGPTSTGCCRK
jgi:hypothetical protein